MIFNDGFYFCCSKQKIQTLETPETKNWKLESKAAPSQNISRNVASTEHGKSKDKRDCAWTSAKSALSTSLPKVGKICKIVVVIFLIS